MWWERFGVAPVRPEDADRGWHKAELVLRQLTQLEKVVRAAGAARSIGWWLGPWQPAPKGHEAVITFYFQKRTEKDGFLDRPPAPAFRQEIVADAAAVGAKSAATKTAGAKDGRKAKPATGSKPSVRPAAKAPAQPKRKAAATRGVATPAAKTAARASAGLKKKTSAKKSSARKAP